jgi:hypothetical protein
MFNSHSNPWQIRSKASGGATPLRPAVPTSLLATHTDAYLDAELGRVTLPDGLLHRIHAGFDAFVRDESDVV